MQKLRFLSRQDEGFATKLLHQQCWCWGCDIKHSGGNLLVKRGFERHRPPVEVSGSTCYELPLEAEQRILLWGFGMAFLQKSGQGVFVHRNKFRPQIISIGTKLPCTAADLNLEEPNDVTAWFRTLNLLRRASQWVTEYENFIVENTDSKYRKRCLRAFHELAQNHRSDTVAQWRFVTARLSNLLSCEQP